MQVVLEKLGGYMAGPGRPADFDLVRVFAAKLSAEDAAAAAAAEPDVFDMCDFTEALFRVIALQRKEGWRCEATQKPYLSFPGKLESGKAYSMAAITVQIEYDPAAYPLRTVFRILDPDIDDMRPVDRLVCETQIIDAISLYDFDHEERDERGVMVLKVKESAWCGTPQHGLYSDTMALITSDCGAMCSPSIKWPYSPRRRCCRRMVGGIHRHKIVPTLPPTLSKEQTDKLICETVFSQMFQLPQPPKPTLYYATLLQHLCKLDRHRAGEPLTPMLVRSSPAQERTQHPPFACRARGQQSEKRFSDRSGPAVLSVLCVLGPGRCSRSSASSSRSEVRDPTTYTITRHDGPNRLGL